MKKNAKRWLAMLLCLTMALSFLPAMALPAFAAETDQPGVTDDPVQDEPGQAPGEESGTGDASAPDNDGPQDEDVSDDTAGEDVSDDTAGEDAAGTDAPEDGSAPDAGEPKDEEPAPEDDAPAETFGLERGSSVPTDGVSNDAWKLDEATKQSTGDAPVCEKTTQGLHLKAGTAGSNGHDSNTADWPAMFVNETASEALFGQNSGNGAKYVEVTFSSVLANTNTRFGVYLHYTDPSKGFFVGYDADGWFWEEYGGTGGTWYKGNRVAGPAANTPTILRLEWTGTSLTKATVRAEGTAAETGTDLFATMPHEFGTTSDVTGTKLGIKCANFTATNAGTTEVYIKEMHYTGQATISTYAVSGKVTDADSKALAGVDVTVSGSDATATTKADGSYSLELPAGDYTLTFTKDGYSSATENVKVSAADVSADVQMEESDIVQIETDGVNNEDWRQVASTKRPNSISAENHNPYVDPATGELVLTSGDDNGYKLTQCAYLPALFLSDKMTTALASTQGKKTLSFTLIPESIKESPDGVPDYLAFGVAINSNEGNEGYMINYGDEGWFFQSYGGSGGYGALTYAAPVAGQPLKFEFTWDQSVMSVKINGQEVKSDCDMAGLTATNKVAFFVGGSYFDGDARQSHRHTRIRISDLHYSGQETVPARFVSGTVKCGTEAIAGAAVSAGKYSAETDAAGAYKLKLPISSTAYTIRAEKDGYTVDEKSVSVTESAEKDTLKDVDFTLIKMPTISGKVVDKNNKPLRGASVSSDLRPEGKAVACDADGNFTIVGAVDGKHTLTVSLEGYETTTKEVTVSGGNVDAGTIQLPDRVILSYELRTADMTVRVAQAFPQVIDYTMKDGKVMYGQTAELDTILINGALESMSDPGVAVKPRVSSTFDETNPTKVTYTMVIDETNNNGSGVTATITAEIRVGLSGLNDPDSAAAGRTLGFYITGVEYAGADAAAKAANRLAHPLDNIAIPNHSLVSVRSTQTGANVSGAKLAANTTVIGDKHYTADGEESLASAIGGYKEDFFSAFVYNSELSAGLSSNSSYAASGTAGSANYPVRVQFEAKDGNTAASIGLSSTLWYYDHDISRDEPSDDKQLTYGAGQQLTNEQKIVAPLEMPYAKVVITGDMNENGKVDWQDGAIAYRETIMHIPANSEHVADSVNLRISMNFGSMATNPFLIALDNVKRVAANTDGLGQFVLLKGYAGEGHDSNHPQYDNIGVRMGGPADMITLMEEGEKLGATFGIHTNASEFYAEAINEENQVRRFAGGGMQYGWNWLDQGIKINGVYDYASGLQLERWDKLYDIVEGHPFVVYVDVWGNNTSGTENDFMTRALSRNIVSHDGWRIAHEWSWANPYESTFQHWVTDYTYGDYSDKGKLNSNIMRFLLNQYKDSFTPDFATFGGAANAPLLGGPAMQGFEGWQGDGEYDLSIYNTFNQMVYTKFLQHYPVVEWTNASAVVKLPYSAGANGARSSTSDWTPETQVKLSDGTDDIVVTRGTTGQLVTDFDLDTEAKFLEGETEYRSRVVTLNGKVIVKGAPASAGEDTAFPASKATLQYLIPWYWDASGARVTADNEKLYHWNAQGGSSTWDLPKGWTNLANVVVYELSDQGRGAAQTVPVNSGKVTLTAKANTAYVVTKGADKAGAPEITYGLGLHLEDPSFNIDTANGPWTITGNGSAVRFTNPEGISVLKMIGPVSVSQQLTELTAGTKYVTYAAVDNRSNAKAVMTITDNTGKVVATNYTQRSIAKNYVSSYYLHNNHGVEAGGSYFQNMFLYFTPETGKEYTLTLSREAGGGSVYFDDVRTLEYGFNYSGFGKGQTAQTDKGRAEIPVTYDSTTGAITGLHQDFENVPQGIWPFVVGPAENIADNRVHVSELNVPFTQAGWDVKKLDDVIDGNWSIKINGLHGRNNLVYQTIPQNFRFEPGSVYTVEFDYELGSTGSYVAVVGDGAYTGLDGLTVINLERTLLTTVPTNPTAAAGCDLETSVHKANVGHAKFTVVGAASGQTWIGIYSKDNADNQGTSGSASAFGGYLDFVLDNLHIELAPADKNALAQKLLEADPMVEAVYTEQTDGDWAAFVTARTDGHTVFDKDNATTAEVTAALEALTAAMAKLTKVNVSISGTVKNANGAPVEGAVLTLENGTYFPVGLTATTDANGAFQFVSKSGVELVPGTYHIKAEATGYYVTTTDNIVVTKTDGAKTKDIPLDAEAPGAYVNDFNSGDISMMGHLLSEEEAEEKKSELPGMEWIEYNGSGALKVTWHATTGEVRHTNNVVDKTVAFSNGTASFDVTALTTGVRFNVTLRGTAGDKRVAIGQQDDPKKWMGEFWNTDGSGYSNVTTNLLAVEPGTTRNIRVVAEGTVFTVFVDGIQAYSVDASSGFSNAYGALGTVPTDAGYVGINARYQNGAEFILDNIRIIRADPAQGVQNVSGTVKARSGVAVSGAAVELFDSDDVRVAGTTTNALGEYQISRVAPDSYTMKVSAPFFQGQQKNVTVASGSDLTNQNFILVPDISDLTKLIDEVEALTEADYTVESWADLAEALEAAEAIDEATTTIAALNTAYRDLSNAKAALVRTEAAAADYSALRTLYNNVSKTQNAGYTSETWTAFQDALAAAQEVLASTSATQDQINDAKTALETTSGALRKASFTVTFDSKGGSTTPTAQTVEANRCATKPAADPERTGYAFAGWYLTEDCSGTAYNFESVVVGNITLYAKWTVKGKALLTEALAAANAAKENIESMPNGTTADQVAKDVRFVTEADMTALETAIASAKAIEDKANASQVEIDSATEALKTATATFTGAIKTGTNENVAPPVNKDKLTEALTAANAAKDTAGLQVKPDGTTAANVNKGDEFVTEGEMKALTDAIEAAQAIASYDKATQAQVDDAVTALNAATATFNSAIKTGAYEPDSAPVVVPSTPSTTTKVEKNEDGSTTTTVTDKKTGTVTETTEKPDGTKEVVETKKDGTVTETVEKTDGSKEVVETKKDGTVTETKTDAEGAKTEKITDAEKNVEIKVTDAAGEVVAEVKLPAEIPAPETRFEDVPEGHWADEAIHEMAGLEVVKGVGNNEYNMSGSMKRGDLALLLSRISNNETEYETKFTDVPADKYYANGIAWAVKTGVVTGYSEELFKPENTITRGELAVMLYRYAKLLKLDIEADASALDAFTDGGSTADWAADGVAWCVKNGIMQGKGNNILDSKSNVTRAEVAVMLQRFTKLMK